MKELIITIVESPYRPVPPCDTCPINSEVPIVCEGCRHRLLQRNISYFHSAALDCIVREEIPYASHAFFTQFLDDANDEQRALGIACGLGMMEALSTSSAKVRHAMYTDLGITVGMLQGRNKARNLGIASEERSLKRS